MAGIRQWVSVNGDPTDGASWNPSGALLNGDSLVFDDGSQVSVTGADISAASLITVIVTPKFEGKIGSSSVPLTVNVESIGLGQERRVTLRGLGDCYIEQKAGDFGNIIVDAPFARTFLFGSWSHVAVKAGLCTFSGTGAIQSRLLVVGDRAKVIVPASGTAVPLSVIVSAGVLEWAKDWSGDGAVMVAFGGKVIFTGRLQDFVGPPDNVAPTIFIGPDCRFEYRPTGALDVLDAPAVVCAGTFDASGNAQEIVFADRFYLPTARILGAPVHRGDITFNGTDFDLRKDYP